MCVLVIPGLVDGRHCELRKKNHRCTPIIGQHKEEKKITTDEHSALSSYELRQHRY